MGEQNKKIRVIVLGAGRMGKEIFELLTDMYADSFEAVMIEPLEGDTLAAAELKRERAGERTDVVIDFSHPDNFDMLYEFIKFTGCSAIIGTTGLSEEQLAAVSELSEFAAVMQSANYSRGVCALKKLAGEAARLLPDFGCCIAEAHHSAKKDAPSGTALLLGKVIGEAAGGFGGDTDDAGGGASGPAAGLPQTAALRMGTVPGTHAVFFAGEDEVIELRHTAFSKRIFALGAIHAAAFVAGQPKGLYAPEDVPPESLIG